MAEQACLPFETPPPPHCDAVSADDAATAELSLTLLGPMCACDANGQDVLPRVRKTRAVLAVLALAAPRPVLRSRLIELLWSRRDLPQARGSLRQAVRELQTTLGPAAKLIRAERTHIALNNAGLRVDALELAAAGPAHPDRLASWQGELLPDLVGLDPGFDRWLHEQQQALAQRVRHAAEAILAEAHSPDAVLAAAERLLAIDPAHEGAWYALIGAHAARGDRAAALAAFARCRAALSEHCQIAPSAEITALLADLRAVSPPDRRPTTVGRRPSTPRSRVRLGVAELRGIGAEETAQLAAALTEELIVTLSRFRYLGCVYCMRGQSEADIDFLLTGTVQRVGNRLRVLLRLVDTQAAAEVVWAERFDRDIVDIFALQDQLASTTAARIEPRLWLWDAERAGSGDPAVRTPRDLLRQAVPALYCLEPRAFMAAGRLLERAAALDPDDALAHAWAAQWHLFCVGQGWAADPGASMRRARDFAKRAIRLDPEDARGLTLAGHVRGFLDRRPDEALQLHERALAANPNLPLSWCLSGLACTYLGDFEEAIRRIRHAQSLSPDDPLGYFHEMALGMPYLLRGEYDIAAAAGRRAIALNPGFSSSHKGYLAAQGHLGGEEGVAFSHAALMKLEPGFSVEQAVQRSPIATPEARALYAEGLRAAGLR